LRDLYRESAEIAGSCGDCGVCCDLFARYAKIARSLSGMDEIAGLLP